MAERSDFSTVLQGMGQIRDKAKANGYAAAQVRPVITQFLQNHGWSPDEFKAAQSGLSNSAAGPTMQGLTFGFADELRGIGGAIKDTVMNGANPIDAYRQNVAQERNSLEAYRNANPVTSTALELAGGVAPSALATMATGGGAGPATLGGMMREGAKLGALTGGVYGAGQGEGMGDTAMRAATGAALGGAVGAVAPAVVEGGKAAVRAAGRMLPGGEKKAADYAIQRALQRDSLTPADMAQRVQAAATVNKFATPADIGGSNTQGLADLVANAPGEGLDIAKSVLESRAKSGLNRISFDLSRAFGSPKKALEAVAESEAAQAKAAAPLYQALRGADVPDDVWAVYAAEANRSFGQIANSSAKKIVQARYGVQGLKDAPRMDVIDAWKQGMDDQIGALMRAGERNKAAAALAQKARVLDAVDAAVPEYQAARNAYAGPAAFQDAIEEGKNIVKMGPDEVAAWWKAPTRTQSEKDGFRIGAASKLNGLLGNDKAKLPDLTKHLRAPDMQKKIATVIEDPAAVQAWQRSFAMEERMAETLAITKNSRTALRQAAAEDADDMGIVPETFSAMLGNSPSAWAAASKLTGFVGRRIADTFNAKRNAEIARQMLETDPAAAIANFQRLGIQPPARLASPGWGGLAGAQIGGNVAGALPYGTVGRPAEVPY